MSEITEQLQDYTKELEKSLKEFDKKFGVGNINFLGNMPKVEVPTVPCASLKLKRVLGCDIPLGVVIEAFGNESSGKTSLACYFISQVQKSGKYVLYIDTENAFNPDYAKVLGVDIDKLIFTQPDSGEQALDMVEMAIDKIPNLGMIVIDSIATLTPQAELDGNMGDSHMGLQARLIGQALRKLVGKLKKKEISLFCINQIRTNLGVMYGNKDTTTGGRALPFYCSLRFKVSRSAKEDIYEGEDIVGMNIKIANIKNKISTPYRKCSLTYSYTEGILDREEFIDLAMDMGLIRKRVDKYTIKETEEKFEGLDAIIQYYDDNPEKKTKLLNQIDNYLNTGVINVDQEESERLKNGYLIEETFDVSDEKYD